MIGLLSIVGVAILLLPGGGQAPATTRPAVGPYAPQWAEFQQQCTQGPWFDQGQAPGACECWERNLASVQVTPAYALDVLIAANIGGWGSSGSGAAASTTLDNIGDVSVRDAAYGCALS